MLTSSAVLERVTRMFLGPEVAPEASGLLRLAVGPSLRLVQIVSEAASSFWEKVKKEVQGALPAFQDRPAGGDRVRAGRLPRA